MLIRGESGNLVTRQEVPDNGGLACVVADDQSPRAHVAVVVDGEQLHLLGMPCEPPLYRERVMVAAHDRSPLGVEEHGGRGGTRLKVAGERVRRRRSHCVAVHVSEPPLLVGRSARASTAPGGMAAGGGHAGQRGRASYDVPVSRKSQACRPVTGISRLLAGMGMGIGGRFGELADVPMAPFQGLRRLHGEAADRRTGNE